MATADQVSLHIPPETQERIWASYRKLGTVEAVMASLKMERVVVNAAVDHMPLRQVYRRKGSPDTYTKEFLLQCLKEAAEICGEPLTIPAYREEAPKRGWPSDHTHVHAYGTFEAACKAAGVKANPSEGPRKGSYTVEDCLVALRFYFEETGKEPSFERYCEWAREKGQVSGSTIRVKVGSWRKALQQAYTS